MVLKYHISPAPAILENMVVKIWEAGSDGPGGEVYTQVITEPVLGAGHPLPTTITVNGLDAVVHIVRLYTEVSASLLHEYNAEPRADTVQVFDPIRFKIGDGGLLTPAANTDTYQNDLLLNLTDTDYIIFRNNVGAIFPNGVAYNNFPLEGKFVLVSPDVFGDTEEFTIIRNSKQISTVINDSVVGKWFGGFVDVAVNTFYSSTHLRKLIRFSGTCSYTFQGTDTIPIGYGFAFQHFGNAAGIGTINFLNADVKLKNGTTNNALTIPNGSEGLFVFDGALWNIVYLVKSEIGAIAPSAGVTLGAGITNVGDPSGGSGPTEIVITHNLNVSGDYLMQASIRSNTADPSHKDNTFVYSWRHHTTDKPNKVVFVLQEVFHEVQNISIAWVLIKL